MKRFLAALLLLTVGCSAPPVTDLRGEWGGEHVSLTITDKGSRTLLSYFIGIRKSL